MTIQQTTDKRTEPFAFGDNVPEATAQMIQDSFNRANSARSPEVRRLLQDLAREVANMVKVLPVVKAEDAAKELQMLTEAAVSQNATKKHWETVKSDLTASAEMAGILNDRALDLINKIAHLLD